MLGKRHFLRTTIWLSIVLCAFATRSAKANTCGQASANTDIEPDYAAYFSSTCIGDFSWDRQSDQWNFGSHKISEAHVPAGIIARLPAKFGKSSAKAQHPWYFSDPAGALLALTRRPQFYVQAQQEYSRSAGGQWRLGSSKIATIEVPRNILKWSQDKDAQAIEEFKASIKANPMCLGHTR